MKGFQIAIGIRIEFEVPDLEIQHIVVERLLIHGSSISRSISSENAEHFRQEPQGAKGIRRTTDMPIKRGESGSSQMEILILGPRRSAELRRLGLFPYAGSPSRFFWVTTARTIPATCPRCCDIGV
jgi:hypothetical protein